MDFRSDVFLEQTLKEEGDGERKVESRSWGKDTSPTSTRPPVAHSWGSCCLPQFTPEWHPSRSSRQEQSFIPLPNCQPTKIPHISLAALSHVSLPLGRGKKEGCTPVGPPAGRFDPTSLSLAPSHPMSASQQPPDMPQTWSSFHTLSSSASVEYRVSLPIPQKTAPQAGRRVRVPREEG